MRTNHVKAKLARGEASLGAWLNIPGLPIARVMARLGFDWLLVDAEHGAQNPMQVADMVGAIADAGTSAPLVRIPYNSVDWFKWALDAGAWGIIVPMVNTPEEARQAVSLAKYPPLGTRSVGGLFAPYGFGITDRSAYIREVNDEIMVVVQIESAQGLENIDEILSVPGIDVAFVGPNDLHAQLGLFPSTEGAEPEFVTALKRIKTSAQHHHIALGIVSSNGESAVQRLSEGFQMVSVISDAASLIGGATRNLAIAQGYSKQ